MSSMNCVANAAPTWTFHRDQQGNTELVAGEALQTDCAWHAVGAADEGTRDGGECRFMPKIRLRLV